MDKIKSNLNLIIGILTFLFIGFVVYNSFIKKDDPANVEEVVVGNNSEEIREIIDILDKIEKIKIDKKFFTEKISDEGYIPSFNELIDYQTKGEEERPGKSNPFLVGSSMVYSDTTDNLGNADENIDSESLNTDNPVVQEQLVNEETNN